MEFHVLYYFTASLFFLSLLYSGRVEQHIHVHARPDHVFLRMRMEYRHGMHVVHLRQGGRIRIGEQSTPIPMDTMSHILPRSYHVKHVRTIGEQ